MLRFESLHPAIKSRWDALTRALPSGSPLAHPDVMTFMMDEILERVAAALRSASGPGATRPRPDQPRLRCGCGLNPLLPCFLTGEQALIEAAAPELGGRIEEVLQSYRAVAHREIDGFCGVCIHRDKDTCPLNNAGSGC